LTNVTAATGQPYSWVRFLFPLRQHGETPLNEHNPYPTARPFRPLVPARPIYLRRRLYAPEEDWHLPTVSWGAAFVDLLLIVLFAGLIGFVGGHLLVTGLVSLYQPPSDPAEPQSMPIWAAQLVTAFWLMTILLTVWFILKRHGLSPVVFGWPARGETVRQHLFAILLALGVGGLAWFVSAMVAAALIAVFPGLIEGDLQDRFQTLNQIPRGTLTQNAVLMLLVGIQEELLFRGLLLPYMRRLTNSWTIAIMVSTLIFALAHLPYGVIAVIQIEFLALAFALVYVWTRSLIAVAMAHFMFDFVQISIILPLIERFVPPDGLLSG